MRFIAWSACTPYILIILSTQVSSCEVCPSGYSCEDVANTPLPCQPGKWSPIGNSFVSWLILLFRLIYTTVFVQCLLCPAGSSCVDPTLPPVLCFLGQYSPQVSEIHYRMEGNFRGVKNRSNWKMVVFVSKNRLVSWLHCIPTFR